MTGRGASLAAVATVLAALAILLTVALAVVGRPHRRNWIAYLKSDRCRSRLFPALLITLIGSLGVRQQASYADYLISYGALGAVAAFVIGGWAIWLRFALPSEWETLKVSGQPSKEHKTEFHLSVGVMIAVLLTLMGLVLAKGHLITG